MKQIKQFFFNGEKYFIDQNVTILELIQYFNFNTYFLVLEYNTFICKRDSWSTIVIKNQDQIEIITIVGGG